MSAPDPIGRPVRLRLKAGRDRAVRRGHPWIFSGALAADAPESGTPIVDVEDASGAFLGRGFYSAHSQIRVRVVARRPVAIDREFFASRLASAMELRRRVIAPETDGYRVLNAEGDGLPGWTVDRFGDVLVSQMTCAGLDALNVDAYEALLAAFPDSSLLHLGDLPARRAEQLSGEDRWIAGEPRAEAAFREAGLVLFAELAGGQKTGFYCDQRENRRLAARLIGEASLLDLFAHSGAFSLHALRGGARNVVLVDTAERLLATARRQLAANGFAADRAEYACRNVFDYLREGEATYGMVVCDPPPLARRAGDVEKAARAYKDLNRLALRRVAAGGFLLTFSCSSAIDSRLFRQILFAAAVEAGVQFQLLAPLAAGPDHPVSVFHPEGEYLKGWLGRVGGERELFQSEPLESD